MSNCCAAQNKTFADFENIKSDKSELNNCIINLKEDPAESGEVMLLRDNMLYIANKPLFDQSVTIKNKKLIFIISFYIFSYS